MHASEAFVNGAVNKGRRKSGGDVDLAMINTLLFGTSIDVAVEPVDGSADERQSERRTGQHAHSTSRSKRSAIICA